MFDRVLRNLEHRALAGRVGAVSAGGALVRLVAGNDHRHVFVGNVTAARYNAIVDRHQNFGRARKVLLEPLSNRRCAKGRSRAENNLAPGGRQSGQALSINRIIARVFIKPSRVHALALKRLAIHLERLESDQRAPTALASQGHAVDKDR